MTAANALLKAIHQRLSGDAALTAMVGPDGIRDRLLARPKLPAILFGEMESLDFSTSTERAEEHFLTLEIWSEGEGRRQAEEITGRVRALLHDAGLSIDGHALVSLMLTSARTRREPKTRFTLTDMRFRAVTE